LYSHTPAAAQSWLQKLVLLLATLSLRMLPIVNWWGTTVPNWRVIVALKSGGFIRSAHVGNWAKAAAFAKAAQQAASRSA
jgi:hypothetical protein